MAVKAKTTVLEARLKDLVTAQELLKLARIEAGIPELETKLDAAKSGLRDQMVANGIDTVEIPGFHATLIRQRYGAMFVGTEDDIPQEAISPDRKIIPLRTILKKKYPNGWQQIWKSITKRVVVTEKVEELISSGALTVDEASPAFVEREKAAYVRVFEDA